MTLMPLEKVEEEGMLAIAELANNCQIQLAPSADLQDPVRVWINDQEVSIAIRSLEVTSQVSAIAAQPGYSTGVTKQLKATFTLLRTDHVY